MKNLFIHSKECIEEAQRISFKYNNKAPGVASSQRHYPNTHALDLGRLLWRSERMLDMLDHTTVEPLLSLSDLGKILGLGPKSIYIRASQHPELLPPRFNLPGSRLLRWHAAVVKQWMDERAGLSSEITKNEQPPLAAPSLRKRGRPSKEEQIKKERKTGGT